MTPITRRPMFSRRPSFSSKSANEPLRPSFPSQYSPQSAHFARRPSSSTQSLSRSVPLRPCFSPQSLSQSTHVHPRSTSKSTVAQSARQAYIDGQPFSSQFVMQAKGPISDVTHRLTLSVQSSRTRTFQLPTKETMTVPDLTMAPLESLKSSHRITSSPRSSERKSKQKGKPSSSRSRKLDSSSVSSSVSISSSGGDNTSIPSKSPSKVTSRRRLSSVKPAAASSLDGKSSQHRRKSKAITATTTTAPRLESPRRKSKSTQSDSESAR